MKEVDIAKMIIDEIKQLRKDYDLFQIDEEEMVYGIAALNRILDQLDYMGEVT